MIWAGRNLEFQRNFSIFSLNFEVCIKVFSLKISVRKYVSMQKSYQKSFASPQRICKYHELSKNKTEKAFSPTRCTINYKVSKGTSINDVRY